jgi:hypothetical protein
MWGIVEGLCGGKETAGKNVRQMLCKPNARGGGGGRGIRGAVGYDMPKSVKTLFCWRTWKVHKIGSA